MTPFDVLKQFRNLPPEGLLIAAMYDGSVQKIPASMDITELARMLDPALPK